MKKSLLFALALTTANGAYAAEGAQWGYYSRRSG